MGLMKWYGNAFSQNGESFPLKLGLPIIIPRYRRTSRPGVCPLNEEACEGVRLALQEPLEDHEIPRNRERR